MSKARCNNAKIGQGVKMLVIGKENLRVKHNLKLLKSFTKILGQRMKKIRFINSPKYKKKIRDLNQVKCIKDEDRKVLEEQFAYTYESHNETMRKDKDCRESILFYAKKVYNKNNLSFTKVVGKVLKQKGKTKDFSYRKRITLDLILKSLFNLIIDVLSRDIQKTNFGNKGFLLKSNTTYIHCNFSKRQEECDTKVSMFKYLGSILQNDGKTNEDITHRIQVGLLNSGKFYHIVIHLAILYDSGCWAFRRQHERQVKIT
ncbi:hypothetical protein CR513_03412, partial [Mucuna pruriens]